MTRDTSNADDVIDSRDILARIEELQARAALSWRMDDDDSLTADHHGTAMTVRNLGCGAFEAEVDGEVLTNDDDGTRHFGSLADAFKAAETAAGYDASDALSEDEEHELKALLALAEEAAQYSDDWDYGATLIRESYFTQYARELVSDIGDLPRNLPDYIAIDWEATAGNLKVDYADVDYDGVTYLIR